MSILSNKVELSVNMSIITERQVAKKFEANHHTNRSNASNVLRLLELYTFGAVSSIASIIMAYFFAHCILNEAF